MSLEVVTLKLPTFWTTCPLVWFAQTEAQFSLRNISSDDTKYYYVIAALDANTATRALSIISFPPAEQKYELLKSFLTSAFGLSEPKRANALLDLNGLGDRKPSELMDSMLTLLGDQWQPLAFFSRQLRNAELKYSAFDRELLGVHLAIPQFRFMLEGRQFSVYTDHKPLVHAMAKTAELWSSRQQRHLSAISEFTTDIQHVSGKNNTVADCLSCATTQIQCH